MERRPLECIGGGNKLHTYRTFKTVFALEHYLTAVQNRSHLTALARLRTSCHGLEIETGRYHKPFIPPEQCFCKVCKSGEVGDEYNFIFECQPLEHFRGNLMEIVFQQHPGFADIPKTEKMVCIFESNMPCIFIVLSNTDSTYCPIRDMHLVICSTSMYDLYLVVCFCVTDGPPWVSECH